jgi:hypothetical protein
MGTEGDVDTNADGADWRTLISDRHTSPEALLALAERSDVAVGALSALADDEIRLRQTPAIAAAIYRNPRAPLSVANRAIATCHRVGVVPGDIPGFEELALAIAADPAAVESAAADPGFAEMLRGAPDVSAHQDDADADADEVDDADAVDAAETEVNAAANADAVAPGAKQVAKSRSGRRSVVIDFNKLKLYEKIRLATLGNSYCRQNLLRDSNRMVAMATIRSPQITDGEVAKAAGNRALSEEVIRYIANRKELVKQYAVKLALVGNAKCPLAVALRLLPSLHADDVKQLARSKNVPGALSVAAKRLAAARGPQ